MPIEYCILLCTAGPGLAAGEGIETVLSLRRALPTLPLIAALSANHLAALALPLAVRDRRLPEACFGVSVSIRIRLLDPKP